MKAPEDTTGFSRVEYQTSAQQLKSLNVWTGLSSEEIETPRG